MENTLAKIKKLTDGRALWIILLLIIGSTCLFLLYSENLDQEVAIHLEDAMETFAKKEYEKALPKYQKIIKKYPKTRAGHTARYQAGQCYFRLGQYEDAIITLEKCSLYKSDLKSPERDGLIGHCYFQLKKYQQALIYYKKAAEGNTGSRPFYLLSMANTCQKLNNPQEEYACLEEICNQYPHFPEISSTKKRLQQLNYQLEKDKEDHQ